MDKEENATGDGDHEEASGYAHAMGPEEDMEEDVEDDEEDEEDEEVEEDIGDEEENVLTTSGDGLRGISREKEKALVDSRPEGSAKKARQKDLTGASMEEIMEAMNYGMQRRSRKSKKRETVPILSKVVKKAPDLPVSIAAFLAPRDPALWELLFDRFNKRGNSHDAIYCLSRAISADLENMNLKFDRALLYVKLGDYQEAAASYEQIVQACTDNVEALKTGAIMYERYGQQERSIQILEDYLINHPTEADLSAVNLLASILMENNSHKEALQHIEHAQLVFCSEKEMPLAMTIKAGICHAYLGNMEKAESIFSALDEKSADDADLIAKVAKSYISLGHHRSALKVQAILCLYEALKTLEDDIEARLALASILVEEAREDEAILLLSPPKNLGHMDPQKDKSEPWWCNGKVKLKLCNIYRAKRMAKEFVDTIYHLVHESLSIESLQQKVKVKKRLTKTALLERVNVLEDHKKQNLLCRSRPVTPASDLLKAAKAKKLLQKKAKVKEDKRAEAMASGVDWQSDDSDDDPPEEIHKEPPLPNLLKDKEHNGLIIDLSTRNTSSVAEELRSLGAQIAYNTPDPEHGVSCVKYIVDQHPYSNATWNCYYKVITRLDDWYARHYKFLRNKRDKLRDCAPPSLIFRHHFTKKSRHQDAAREYLEAYKLLPENPLINLCVGTALINLSLGHRLQNRHQCVVQGLAFLHNNLQLYEFSQEAFYNVARAYHHVGLVTLAAWHYDKVLAMQVKDYPMPKLPHEKPESTEN
ncbi:hypothetical protein C1H46_024098 [Malus baccata]|uniref:Uncharacterized protein n=1 Tax=Malus baccata TaxID=106549 RepID=A0A540LV09_MALBA|nr:hypothetical protein C1H46_024098 [Malus baccata]